MRSVIKMPQLTTNKASGRLFSRAILVGLVASLAACTTYRDIPANAPANEVMRVMGQPSHSCDRPGGGKHYVWSSQPMGQYIYGADIGADGYLINSVYSVLTPKNFKKLDTGTWTAQDVLCEFGRPAEIETMGLGEKREQVWSYRYREANIWDRFLFIYMGRDGQRVTRWSTGPDLRFDGCWLFGC